MFVAQSRASGLYVTSPLKFPPLVEGGERDECWIIDGPTEREAHQFKTRAEARQTVTWISGGRLADFKITRRRKDV